MPLLYSASIGAYHLAVRIAGLWNPKARAWVRGREGLWDRLEARREKLRGCLWMHCASVGEFEQGRPVLEAVKARHPELPVLLTFFSPSGYEARKDFPLATHVEYLPTDSPAHAKRMLELVAPRAAIFVKYEFWYHHLHALKMAAVPTFLVSAIFREGQPFFQWYGAAWRSMLACYARIFVQDERSKELLAGVGITNVTVSGDTRFDRVMAIVKEAPPIPFAQHMRIANKGALLVCGSTWPADEQLIATLDPAIGKIIVPHEISPAHLASIRSAVQPVPMLVTEYEQRVMSNPDASWPVVLFDRYGALAALYRYGDVAYVGGGFGDGIHSLLEAAAWGKPVIFGPKHTKFAEAKGLIDAGGGFEVRSAEELRAVLDRLLSDKRALAKAGGAAATYVRDRVGATERTVDKVLAGLEPDRS